MAARKHRLCLDRGHNATDIPAPLMEDPLGKITTRCLRHRVKAAVYSGWFNWARSGSLLPIEDQRKKIENTSSGYLAEWKKGVYKRHGTSQMLTLSEEYDIREMLRLSAPTEDQQTENATKRRSGGGSATKSQRSKQSNQFSPYASKKRKRTQKKGGDDSQRPLPHLSPGPPEYTDPSFNIDSSPEPERQEDVPLTKLHKYKILCKCEDPVSLIDFQDPYNPARPHSHCKNCRAEAAVTTKFESDGIDLKDIYEAKSNRRRLPDNSLRDDLLNEFRAWYRSWEAAMHRAGYSGLELCRSSYEKFVTSCVGDFWLPTPTPEAEKRPNQAREVASQHETAVQAKNDVNAGAAAAKLEDGQQEVIDHSRALLESDIPIPPRGARTARRSGMYNYSMPRFPQKMPKRDSTGRFLNKRGNRGQDRGPKPSIEAGSARPYKITQPKNHSKASSNTSHHRRAYSQYASTESEHAQHSASGHRLEDPPGFFRSFEDNTEHEPRLAPPSHGMFPEMMPSQKLISRGSGPKLGADQSNTGLYSPELGAQSSAEDDDMPASPIESVEQDESPPNGVKGVYLYGASPHPSQTASSKEQPLISPVSNGSTAFRRPAVGPSESSSNAERTRHTRSPTAATLLEDLPDDVPISLSNMKRLFASIEQLQRTVGFAGADKIMKMHKVVGSIRDDASVGRAIELVDTLRGFHAGARR